MSTEWGELRDKMRALALFLDHEGDTPGAGDAIREVLDGKRDDRAFFTRIHFCGFVTSMREVEDDLRAHGHQAAAEEMSRRIDKAVIDWARTS